MGQIEINFESGLLQQFPRFQDCVRASVYGCGKAFKVIAGDLDMSPSELSRKLADNPNDPIHFPLPRLPDLIHATHDLRPIHWLIEAFLEDADARRKRALDQVAALLPELVGLIQQAKRDG